MCTFTAHTSTCKTDQFYSRFMDPIRYGFYNWITRSRTISGSQLEEDLCIDHEVRREGTPYSSPLTFELASVRPN